jgi:holo-[acyl-carrier protein] synthase
MTPLRVGIDLVQIRRIAESLEAHGERFLERVFTEDEIAYAKACPAQTNARLAARFAAKEATIKALGLAEHPVIWRDIEVRRAPSGACEMALHRTIRQLAAEKGNLELAVSLSHEGDYATAVVVARARETTETE